MGDPSTGFGVFVHVYSGTLGIWVDAGEPVDPSGYSTIGIAGLRRINDGAWHHVAIVQQDTPLRGYVDGRPDLELRAAGTLAGLTNDEPLWLGWAVDDFIHLRGEVDEFSVWARALTRRENPPTHVSPSLGR